MICNKRRLISALLVLAMVLSMLPMAVFATGTVRLYCDAPSTWTKCNVYYWSDANTKMVSWPGVAMTKGSDGIWYYDVPAEATKVIFNNGSVQSSDLDMPTDDNVQFNYSAKIWTTYGTEVEEPVIEMVTVYVEAPASWGTPNAYFWGSSVANSAAWPGDAMTHYDGNVYSVTVPSDCVGVIFNGGGSQTDNLTVPTDNNVMYSIASSAWGELVVNEPVEVTYNYVVAGPAELCGTEWDIWNTANTMTVNGDVASITYTDVYAGSYELKVVALGSDGSITWYGNGEANVMFTLGENADVTVSFLIADSIVSVDSDGLVMEPDEPEEPVEVVYYLRGDMNSWGADESNAMVLQDDGTYAITISLTAGTYEYKAANADWSWSVPSGTDNLTLELAEDAEVTFVLDVNNCTLTNNAPVAEEPVEVTMVTVYAAIPDYWGAAYAYWWNSSVACAEWPGIAMTYVDGNVYSCEVPSDLEGLLFNNANGIQTGNLTVDGEMYTVFGGTWGAYNVVEQQYYLRGTMNEWTETAMVSNGDGTWSVTVTLDADTYEYKVSDAFGEWYPAENLTLTLDAYSNVTFTINAADSTISVTSEAIQLEEYVIDDTVLVLGENNLTLNPGAITTIYEFTPEENGIYSFTANDENALVGYWGGGSFFVWDQTENKTSTLEFTLKYAGPSIMVGISGVKTVTLNIVREGDPFVQQTFTTVYENTHSFINYTLPAGAALQPIDGELVLGDDGFYHVGSANGALAVIDFNNIPMPLANIAELGQMSVATVGEDGHIYKIDYCEAVQEYIKKKLYPVTEELAMMIQDVADAKGWVADGYVYADDPAEAWVAFCQKVKLADVKWQLNADATSESETVDLRLISWVDSLDYSKVTFVVEINGQTAELSCETVYTAINNAGSIIDGADTLFGADAAYFVTHTITNLPAAYYDTAINVYMVWTDLDGVETVSMEREIIISDAL